MAADSLSKSQKKRLKKKATAERKKQEAEENGGEGIEHCMSSLVSDHSCLVVMQLVEHHRSTYLKLKDGRFEAQVPWPGKKMVRQQQHHQPSCSNPMEQQRKAKVGRCVQEQLVLSTCTERMHE